MRKRRYLALGSISTGTLRHEDVIPALLDACDTVRMSREDRDSVSHIRDSWEGADDPYEFWDALTDLLDRYAPPYCYVGAHPGDGADIGVWIDDGAIDVAEHEGEVWRPRNPDGPWPPDARYRLVVSDHGNMTLYYRNGREVWGIV